MSRLLRIRLGLLALAGLLLFCRPARPVPRVEYGRCRAVYLPGPVCVLWPDRGLYVWMKAGADDQVRIRAGHEDLEGEVQEVEGGRRYRLLIPHQAESLTVSLQGPDGRHGPRWTLTLSEPEIPAWLKEIESMTDSKKIRRRLCRLREEAPRKEQGLVLGAQAELARREGSDEAERYLEEGIAADRAEQCLTGEVEKTTLLARLYLEKGRFRKALERLEALELPRAPVEAKYRVAYYRGLLAESMGNYRLALEQLREAIALAEKIRRNDSRWQAQQVLARVLQDLGRSQEASALFEQLREDVPSLEDPCDLGVLFTNSAWARLLRQEGGEKAEDPTPELEKAQIEFDQNRCRPMQRLNARINLALAHQQAGRGQEARQALEEARSLISYANLRQRLWWHDLEARAAIAEGHPGRALRLYEELEEMAKRALSFEGRFRASLGRAQALLALSRRAAALEALAEADRLIDEQTWNVPAHEGRDTLVEQREVATRLYLKLLLEEGQLQEAFDLARRARSRLLRQLMVRDRLFRLDLREQQRWEQVLEDYQALRNGIDREAAESWKLSGDPARSAEESRAVQLEKAREDLERAVADLGIPEEGRILLAQPRPGEVILVYHPLPEGWVGFAADEWGIEVSTFELPRGRRHREGEYARVLLEPFHRTLERAERVRVLPYGSLRAVDFHILPFAGEPLLARRLVVYGLDLPVRPSRVSLRRSKALLVSDPEGNLSAARQEAVEITAAIRAWSPGWDLERLDSTASRAETVRAALPDAGLFHYAGHGTFAGFAGWDSVLRLADGSRLTVGDVLALHRAPDWVVLSACEVGRSSEEAPGEGIGLAHAFLLAGSQAVIAATREVPDEIARDLSIELYRGWRPGMDLARELQRAQRVCLDHHAAKHCASFRLVEP